ncbi:MAG TPA: tetratricopeptide repeat protein, partial [Bacteroidia bacterium]
LAYFKVIKKIQYADALSAIRYADTSLAISQKINYAKGIAFSEHYLGFLYMGQRLFSRALTHLTNANAYYKKMGDRRNAAAIFNNIGGIYFDLANYKKAEEYYSKALVEYRAVNNDGGIAMILHNMGSIIAEQGRYEEADYYYRKAYGIRTRISDTDGIVSTLLSRGLAFQKLGQPDSGLVCFPRAARLALVSNNIDRLAVAWNYLADLYMQTGKKDSAVKYFVLADGEAKKVGDPTVMRNVYKSLFTLYDSTGDKVHAFDYYKKYITIRDSVFSQENAQKFVQTEMNFTFEQQEAQAKAEQEKKDAITQRQKQTASLIRNSFIAGSLLLLLLGLFVLRGYLGKRKDNLVLEQQRKEIAESKQEIQDSIHYAKSIQDAMLPSPGILRDRRESFIFFRPKDVVSGDFYWFHFKGAQCWIAAADCTGHGVPGAFMSTIAAGKLNGLAAAGLGNTGEILSALNTRMIDSLKQERTGYSNRDGMDIALCCIRGNEIEYSGANRPLWLIRNGEVQVIEGDKNSIGGFTPADTTFASTKLQLQPGDRVYVFSDGYADQFGGDSDKKFSTRRFRELLLSSAHLTMEEQQRELERVHHKWREMNQQTDDILVIGIKIEE